MRIAQRILRDVPEGLSAKADQGHAEIGTKGSGKLATFLLYEHRSLSADAVDRDVLPTAADASKPLLVVFERASPEARHRLRDAGVSYAGADGRWFLTAPGLYVERDDRIRPLTARLPTIEGPANPFGIRTSRVPRWMLLHPDQAFGISELARVLELSPASVSRTVAALEDEALAEPVNDPGNRRSKRIRLTRPSALLDAWLPAWQRRRTQRLLWDIGSHDVEETLDLLRTVATGTPDAEWAIGGIAGASLRRRAVEPRDVLIWTRAEDLSVLADQLMPVETRSPYRASLRVALAPDPFVLGLAHHAKGLPIADPVQLWLDCMSEGERAMEAAMSIRDEQRW